MKAILMDDYGGPEVLRYGDAPDPAAGPGGILVDIYAASVNPADWKVRAGYHKANSPLTFPHILGRDFSGVVHSVDSDVTEFAPGDIVFAVTERDQEGAYAERIAISAALIAAKPPGLSHAEAASVALTGLTALVALEDCAGLGAGETVLIHGGAGGVGSFAVQLAKHLGAEVFTTARAVNHDYLRGFGADGVIDYAHQDFVQEVPACDVVFDTIGGDVLSRSVAVLRPGGRLVHVAPGPPGFESPREDVTITRPHVGRDRAHLERITELVSSGVVRVPQIECLPLAEAAAAQTLSQAGHVRGKIVLQMR